VKRLLSTNHAALLGWLLLLGAVALAALWQAGARGRQLIDSGAALDEGAVEGFYGRELSDDGSATSFRWSRPLAELRFRPAPAPAMLRLRLLAPLAADGAPSTLAVALDGRGIGSFAVADTFRIYSLALPPGSGAAPRVSLEASERQLPGDPRALGLVLDRAALLQLDAAAPGAAALEPFVFPFLPLGVALAALAAALAGARQPIPALVAALGLGTVVLLASRLQGGALTLAWALTVGAAALTLALGVARLALRLRGIFPASDGLAIRWLCAGWALGFALGFAPWVASDGTGYYAYTRSLVIDGDLDFANEYREMPFPHTPLNPDQQVVAATGYSYNPFSIGPGLLWLPGFALAHLFVLLGPGAAWAADGYSLPYVALSLFVSAAAGLLMLLAMYRVARRAAAPGMAALACLAVFFGANPLYYTLREGSFAHGVSGMAAALFLLAWLRLEERPTPRRWAAVGASGGLVALLYWASALVLLPAALSMARQLLTALRSPSAERAGRLRAVGLGAGLALLCGLLVVSPQLVAWNIIFGTPLTVPQGSGFITPEAPRYGEFLFSMLHGLLPWTPAYFVGMLGLALLWRERPWWLLCLGLSCLIYLSYNAALSTWHGGGAFGMRRFTALAPWCALGLAALFTAMGRRHWALPVGLAALMGAWTTLLTVRYDLYLIDRNVGSLREMPPLAFFLGYDALPLERLGDWVRGGFFFSTLDLPNGGMPWVAVISLVLLVAALAVAALALALRSFRTRPELEAPAAEERPSVGTVV
jgi:hypothetical protein